MLLMEDLSVFSDLAPLAQSLIYGSEMVLHLAIMNSLCVGN